MNKPAPYHFEDKLAFTGTTIFSTMSQLALQEGAHNLSQGFPDFPVDPRLLDLVYEAMKEGYNQYAPLPGHPDLLASIARHLERCYGFSGNSSHITITTGATEGLYAAITALIHPGDEVILFEPCYDAYEPAIRLQGATVSRYVMKYPDYSIDWNRVEGLISDRTKALLINHPHNPTGRRLSFEDLKALESLALRYKLLVISDEVYDQITLDDEAPRSLLQFPALRDQCLVLFSFGKTFHATGWKVGYLVSSEFLTERIRKCHQFITYCVSTPMQVAIAKYLDEADLEQSVRALYRPKRDLFLEGIKASRFEIPFISEGSYFQLLSFKAISKEKAIDFCKGLTTENKVASIPVSYFYEKAPEEHVVRFCFAKEDSTLEKACEILSKI